MFVALEVLSLPLYLLCGLARRRRLLSQEAAMKYFLLGAFSSAFFLFGIAMLYGFSGSVRLSAIASAASSNTANATLLFTGIALLGVGPAVQDRRGAVPRLEARRLPGRADPGHRADGRPARWWPRSARCCASSTWRSAAAPGTGGRCSWVVAILTMLVGAVVAITQTDVKRLLAYSSIAHAGLHPDRRSSRSARPGCPAALFYLVAYGFTTVGAFAVITLVRDAGGEADAPVPVGGPGHAGRRWSPGSSRCSCSRSPASR